MHPVAGSSDDVASSRGCAGRPGRCAGRGCGSSAAASPEPAHRCAHRADGVPGNRRAAPGRGHRLRRGQHGRVVRSRGDRRIPAPRLALPDRWGHRPGAPGGRRRRSGRSRPPGDRPRGRRQRAVHHPVVVDHGPRGPRRHHGDTQQPLLRGVEHGTRPGGCRDAGPSGPGHARPRSAGPGLRSDRPAAWGSRHHGPRQPNSSPTNWPDRSLLRVRAWSRLWCPAFSESTADRRPRRINRSDRSIRPRQSPSDLRKTTQVGVRLPARCSRSDGP